MRLRLNASTLAVAHEGGTMGTERSNELHEVGFDLRTHREVPEKFQ